MQENKIIQIKVGEDVYPTNCYIIYDKDKNAVVIDPGYEKEKIISHIENNNLKVTYIILTHTHADHLGELNAIKEYTGAKVILHENEVDGLEDDEKSYFTLLNIEKPNISKEDIITVKDQDEIKLGNIILEVLHTPGHTNGCICLYEKSLEALFTGDTIFTECYGRVDLKTGSFEDIKRSIEMLFNRFENIYIYPGHDEIDNIDNCKRKIRLLLSCRGM